MPSGEPPHPARERGQTKEKLRPAPLGPSAPLLAPPGQEGAAGGASPTHARTHTRGFVHAPRARPARPPSTTPQPPPSFARPLGVGGQARFWAGWHFKLARGPPLPPSPPHLTASHLSPYPGQGPRGLRGAGSPRTQWPGRAPWVAHIFHRIAPGFL